MVFYEIKACSLVGLYRNFGETFCILSQEKDKTIKLLDLYVVNSFKSNAILGHTFLLLVNACVVSDTTP